MSRAEIKKELEQIREAGGGKIKADAVVEFARDPKTALHSKFEWDDNKASHEYRLWQARHVISVHVTVVEGCRKPVPAYVSLQRDRNVEGGGYRAIADVMSDEQQRAELLQQAATELMAFKRKYARLTELNKVFEAIEEVVPKHTKRRKAS